MAEQLDIPGAKRPRLLDENYRTPTYGEQSFISEIPSCRIPDFPMSPRAAQRLINDELDLDARNSSDLGSYITDYMDPEIDAIINSTLGKVFIDKSEYPLTAEIGDRIARMIQNWYHGIPATTSGGFIGTPTIGSSEAVMLALIAHRYTWEKAWKSNRQKTTPDGYPVDYYRKDKPFMLAARDIHTCWHKYSLYYNTPSLIFNMSDEKYTISAEDVDTFLTTPISILLASKNADHSRLARTIIESCDFDAIVDASILEIKTPAELVFVVGAVVGSTFTGSAGPVAELSDVLVRLKTKSYPGTSQPIDIPIHVDAACGGFSLPFTAPALAWDFRVEQVKSINVSNHKFGLVYPGVGTIVFKHERIVNPDLIYNITYLGAAFQDYTVNFSRGSAMVIAAYYNLIRFGKQGYGTVIMNCMSNTSYFAHLINTGDVTGKHMRTISSTELFPIVVWKGTRIGFEGWTLAHLSQELAKRGWKLPAYKLPYTDSDNPDGPLAMRVVIRQDLSRDKIVLLYNDIVTAITWLETITGGVDQTNPDVLKLLRADHEHYTLAGLRGC